VRRQGLKNLAMAASPQYIFQQSKKHHSKIMKVVIALLLLSSSAVAFHSPAAAFGVRQSALFSSAAETGIETGVIWGIKEDDPTVDFGRCGVKLAEDTVVRMSGFVSSGSAADWKTLDNVLKLTTVTADESTAAVTIVASAASVEDYKDPGTGTVKEVIYAPNECAKACMDQVSESTAARIVVNVAGGDDLQVSEVLEAVLKVSSGFKGDVTWNSLSFKEFALGQATMVVVAMDYKIVVKQQDDGDDEVAPLSGLAAGELYMQDGKYLTIDEKDIIDDFSEDWMV